MKSHASRNESAPRTRAHPTPDEAVPPGATALGSARLALPPRGLRRLSQVFFRRSSAEHAAPVGGLPGACRRSEEGADATPRAALELRPPEAHGTGVRAAGWRGPTAAASPPDAFGDVTPLAGDHGPTPVPDAPQRGRALPTTPNHCAAPGSPALEDGQRTVVEPPHGEERGPGPSARRLSNFTYAQYEAERSGLGPEDANAHTVARKVLQSPIQLREGGSPELAWALPARRDSHALFCVDTPPAYSGDAPLDVERGDRPPAFSVPHVWDDDEDAMEPAEVAFLAELDALLSDLAPPLQLSGPRPKTSTRTA